MNTRKPWEMMTKEEKEKCRTCGGEGGWEELEDFWDDRTGYWVHCPNCSPEEAKNNRIQ